MSEEITEEKVKTLFSYKQGNLYWLKPTCHHVKYGEVAGTFNKSGYEVISINSRKYHTHRLIFLYHKGYMPKFVDHKDHNKLNNNIGNLRKCTKSENAYNRTIQKNNTSGVKGVSWNKAAKKWRTQLKFNKKIIYIGEYKDINQAKEAIFEAREKYHGEFANHG